MMPAVRFEKWQALGNDYLIVEARGAPVRAHARSGCGGCATRTSGPAATACSSSPTPTQPGFVARLRIFNPDGSEAELSGNGAREAILYLRRARLDRAPTRSRSRPRRGRSARRSRGRPPAAWTWAARGCGPKDFPDGPDDGCGEVEAGGRRWRFQHVSIGNPQCAIRVESATELEALDLAAIGPGDRARAAVPQPHEHVVLVRARARTRIRARIFERGVGETLSSGTGRLAAPPSPTCCAAATRRSPCGSTAASWRSTSTSRLHVDLTGWAVPVYRGELSPELVAELGSMG